MRNARSFATLLVSLAGLCACSSREKYDAQATPDERERFANAIAVDAGAASALGVGSRNDVLFEEGFSVVLYDPPDDYRNHAFRWMGQRGHVRVRGHGDHAMKLKIRGWVNEKVIRSRPIVTVYLDGRRIYDTGPVEGGLWGAESVITADTLGAGKWHDLVITLSAIAFHWADPPKLTVAVLNELEWTEMP